MNLILDTTDSTSLEFYGSGGQGLAHCITHNGGVWRLQLKHPDGTDSWTDLDDVEFTKADALWFRAPQGNTLRFNGGTAGAVMYVQGVTVNG